MKVFGTILKILAALAAIAGAVYVVATYGDKIVAWAKGLMHRLGLCGCGCDCTCQCEDDCDDCQCEDDCDECQCGCCCEEAEEVAQEAEASEEAPAEAAQETPAVQAEETDFQG